jgi:hypothetical protein
LRIFQPRPSFPGKLRINRQRHRLSVLCTGHANCILNGLLRVLPNTRVRNVLLWGTASDPIEDPTVVLSPDLADGDGVDQFPPSSICLPETKVI